MIQADQAKHLDQEDRVVDAVALADIAVLCQQSNQIDRAEGGKCVVLQAHVMSFLLLQGAEHGKYSDDEDRNHDVINCADSGIGVIAVAVAGQECSQDLPVLHDIGSAQLASPELRQMRDREYPYVHCRGAGQVDIQKQEQRHSQDGCRDQKAQNSSGIDLMKSQQQDQQDDQVDRIDQPGKAVRIKCHPNEDADRKKAQASFLLHSAVKTVCHNGKRGHEQIAVQPEPALHDCIRHENEYCKSGDAGCLSLEVPDQQGRAEAEQVIADDDRQAEQECARAAGDLEQQGNQVGIETALPAAVIDHVDREGIQIAVNMELRECIGIILDACLIDMKPCKALVNLKEPQCEEDQ